MPSGIKYRYLCVPVVTHLGRDKMTTTLQNDRHFADSISKFTSLYEIQQKSYLIKVTPLMQD